MQYRQLRRQNRKLKTEFPGCSKTNKFNEWTSQNMSIKIPRDSLWKTL